MIRLPLLAWKQLELICPDCKGSLLRATSPTMSRTNLLKLLKHGQDVLALHECPSATTPTGGKGGEEE